MIGQLAFVLLAVAVVVLARLFGERSGIPSTILLTVAGLVYAFLPGRNLSLDPDVVLLLVLPPILYSAALGSSLLAIRANLRPVISLSVLLVLATAIAVGSAFAAIVPGVGLAAGVAFGAAVAPPDPVASLSVGRRAGLPPKLTTLIEGEGLLNDATALTTFQVGVAAAVGGGFSVAGAVGKFSLSAVGGLAIGVAVALLVRLPRPLLRDPLSATALSLATPFATYLAAEEIHVSGVLAVVVAGLVIAHDEPRGDSGARLQSAAVWHVVEFILEGFIFLLIGQQLPQVVRGLHAYDTQTVVLAAVATVLIVLTLRPIWLVAMQYVPLPRWGRSGESGRSWRVQQHLDAAEVTALSWAGTRGVISLAAVYAIPLTVNAGGDFPGRDLMLFCSYLVVLVTLVGQGLTFAPLLRRLRLRANAADEAQVRNSARAAAVEAALQRLDELVVDGDVNPEVADRMRGSLTERLKRYQDRIIALEGAEDGEIRISAQYSSAVRARRAIIEAQQEEFLRWRDEGRLPDASLRKLQRELDYEERMLPDLR